MKTKTLILSIQNYLEVFMNERPDIFNLQEYEKCLHLVGVLFQERRICKNVCQDWSEKEISAGVLWLFSCINLLYKKPDHLSLESIAEYFEVEKKKVQKITHTLHDECGIGELDDKYLL